MVFIQHQAVLIVFAPAVEGTLELTINLCKVRLHLGDRELGVAAVRAGSTNQAGGQLLHV